MQPVRPSQVPDRAGDPPVPRPRLRRLGADAALYSDELLEDEPGEVVAFVPIADTAGSSGRARDMLQRAGEYAVAVHHGSFDDLDQTFGALGIAHPSRPSRGE